MEHMNVRGHQEIVYDIGKHVSIDSLGTSLRRRWHVVAGNPLLMGLVGREIEKRAWCLVVRREETNPQSQ